MAVKKWIDENWWGSEYNYLDKIRKEFYLSPCIKFHDATLRYGEQTPGVILGGKAKLEIARLLDSLGIDRLEADMPSDGSEDLKVIKEIADLKLKSKLMLPSRAMRADIDKAAEVKAWGILLELPSGSPEMKNQFPAWGYEDIRNISIEAIKYAKDKGLYVTYFPYDTTRAEMGFLENLYTEVVEKARPDSVAVVDAMGCALPQGIYYLVRKIKSWVDIPVEIHTRNDFGMAVANSLAAIEAGAEVVHGSLNGLGKRAGLAALEQIFINLESLLGAKTNIDFKKLYKACVRVSELSKVSIPVNMPFTGDAAFSLETGAEAKLSGAFSTTVFPIAPSFLNREPRIILGKNSSRDSVGAKLAELDLALKEEKLDELLTEVIQCSIDKGTFLTDEEFKDLYLKVAL